MRLLQRQSCQQMVHGVFNHEHLTRRCSLLCACYALVMSADGFMEVCTHEHLFDSCSLCSALASASHVSRWFMEFALMNI
jgi:hypothetical protein